MKICVKIITVIFVIIIVSTFSLTALGLNNVAENPISIVVETDKSSYSYTKIATFDVTVTNSSQNIIENVTAQVVFDELSPVAKGNNTHKKEVKELKPGESFSFSYKATLNPNKNKLNFFQKIIFWFVQLFNNGYDVSTERINDGRNITELVSEIDFGKFRPNNVIEVAYNIEELPEQPNEPDNISPEKIKGITITKVGSDYISLMWEPSANADGYLMLIKPKNVSDWSSKIINHNAFTFTGLTPETAYEIIVYASKNGSLSEKSNTVMVVTDVDSEEPPIEESTETPTSEDKTTATDDTGLSAPTNFKLIAASHTSVTFSWAKVSGAHGYKVYRYHSDTQEWLLIYDVKTTHVTDNTLKPQTQYSYRIKAYKEVDGKTYFSPASSDYSISTAVIPNITEIRLIEQTEKSITFSWTDIKADGYEIYNADNEKLLIRSSETAVTIGNLNPNETYRFKIRGYYLLGDIKFYSEFSYAFSATTLQSQEEPTTIPAVTTTKPSTKPTEPTTQPTEPATKPTTEPTTNDTVSVINFTKKTTSMTIGETFSTSIKIEPDDINNTAVTYMSSDPSVAQIDKTGKITAIGLGVTKIIVTTADGVFSDSFILKVVEVNLQGVSVESNYSAYVGEGIIIKPIFTPENASDKSFTLVGSDYTYTYKGGLFGTTTKTDVCFFSDYFHIDNNAGIIIAKKATIEPETGNTFSFVVQLNASNGKTTTFNLSASVRLISIYYAGEDNPWYYGNTVKLSADIDSSAGFRADSLIWSSSNSKVASVSQNGTVNCVGTGEVTITATAPVGTKNHSITIYVAPVLTLSGDYFENCTIGGSYQLNVGVNPSGSELQPAYLSSNPDVAVVSADGKVTFKKNGHVTIHISSGVCEPIKAVLTTGSCVLPSGGTMKLLTAMENGANRIKTQMPALYTSNLPTFTNVNIQKEGSFKTADLIGIFESFESSQSKFIPAVNSKNYPEYNAYNSAYSEYLASVPVSGQSLTVIPGLDTSSIKSINVIDNGSYTYDIMLTLNDEFMPVIPENPTTTAHGKVFDILEADYMTSIKNSLSSSSTGVSLNYSAFKQTYNNSSFTLTFDKVTGNVVNMNYDMNVHVEIVDLVLKMSIVTAIDSTVIFDVNNNINYEVIY